MKKRWYNVVHKFLLFTLLLVGSALRFYSPKKFAKWKQIEIINMVLISKTWSFAKHYVKYNFFPLNSFISWRTFFISNGKIGAIKDYDQFGLHYFRFESLTLSHNNMIALKPVLSAWLEEAEAAKRDPDGSGGVLPPGEKKRKRTSIAAPEKRSLEAYFAVQPRPSGEKIAAIAEKLDLKKNVVRVWFCNQRQKQKRMKFAAQTGLWGQTASLAHTLAAGGHGPHHWPGSAISYQNDTMTHITTTNPKFEIGNGNTTTNSASDNDITEQNRLEQNYSNFYSTASMMIKKEELIINNSRYWWFQW